jgi:cell division protein FtsB
VTVKISGFPGLKIETWGTQLHRHDYKIIRSRYQKGLMTRAMQDETTHAKTTPAAETVPLRSRVLEWAQQGWRPAGTLIALALILVFGWGVVNGRHGLSAWEQQRVKDKELRKDIDDLQQENSKLRDHVDRLKSDPGAIEHEAREQLHYAKPGEVIYNLPAQPQGQMPTANPAK